MLQHKRRMRRADVQPPPPAKASYQDEYPRVGSAWRDPVTEEPVDASDVVVRSGIEEGGLRGGRRGSEAGGERAE